MTSSPSSVSVFLETLVRGFRWFFLAAGLGLPWGWFPPREVRSRGLRMILACSPPAFGAANALASKALAVRGLFCGPDPGGLFEGRGLREGVAEDFGDFEFDAVGFGFNEGLPVSLKAKLIQVQTLSNALEVICIFNAIAGFPKSVKNIRGLPSPSTAIEREAEKWRMGMINPKRARSPWRTICRRGIMVLVVVGKARKRGKVQPWDSGTWDFQWSRVCTPSPSFLHFISQASQRCNHVAPKAHRHHSHI